jgi:class 3 adenylate cyclase/tetratricopeptide (TPR) repeat protein
LPVVCPACDTVNQPSEDFCGGCGKTLAQVAAPPARRRQVAGPERRQLTVMFCDLVGSTALSHELDPEDLREVIRSYQEGTRHVIARYEGFVARYMGDGMLAYFGYPQAHEDDAARAIHAGLEIAQAPDLLDALPTREGVWRPRVRIGIATGLVVVGDLIGEGASEEAAAVGETPNLAARLQTLAEPGSVVVAERTRELAGGRFEYADRGTHELKGFDRPVRAWRVLRTSAAESRFDAARTRRMTPFIGRAEEIDLLLGRWRRATEGEGQVVLLVGEAGIGKSRIAETLVERIADEPHIRLRYQCSPYHANSALYPFIQQLERAADFGRGDTAEQKLDKLEALLVKSTPDSGESAPLFAALLSLPAGGRYPALPLTPQQQKQKTFVALLERFRGFAAQAPVFMLLEDVHWIDPTSIEFLDLLARHVWDLPVLVIITPRVAADYAWLGLQHVSSLPLERLDPRQSANMVKRLLGSRKLPADVIEQIVAKTDGVPLFIEEFTKTLATSDAVREGEASPQAVRSEIPSTLHDSLMARLDRLGAAKEVAQVGAVIGREFSRDLVAALSPVGEPELDEALDRLTSSAVVFGRGQPPWTAFIFKHALVQDAAYASLLRSKRQELHRRIAETLESGYPERVRTEPEVVAHHYAQAGQALHAARYSAAAAMRALDRSANVEALGQSAKGLELLAGVAQSTDRDGLELGLRILQGAAYRAVKGFASSDVERSFTRALELSERLDDIPRLIDVRRGLFSYYYARGALALAREQGQHVATLGQRMNDRGSQMLGYWMLGCMAFWQGDYATARQELEDAVALYDPNEQKSKTLALQIDPGVNALCHLSWVLWVLGYPDRAIQTSDRAIRTARELAQPLALAMALFFACATRACCGHDAAGSQLLDELIAISGEHGLGYLGSCARVLKGQELIARDQCVAGLEQVDRALSEFRAQEAGLGLPWSMSIAATGHARLGRVEEGLAALSVAFGGMGRNDERHWEAELWRLKGELLLLRTGADNSEAEACIRQAVDVARRQTARSLELRATMSLARLLDRQGESGPARKMLAEATGWFTEGLDTTDIRDAGKLLRTIDHRRGDRT